MFVITRKCNELDLEEQRPNFILPRISALVRVSKNLCGDMICAEQNNGEVCGVCSLDSFEAVLPNDDLWYPQCLRLKLLFSICESDLGAVAAPAPNLQRRASLLSLDSCSVAYAFLEHHCNGEVQCPHTVLSSSCPSEEGTKARMCGIIRDIKTAGIELQDAFKCRIAFHTNVRSTITEIETNP